MFVNRDLLRRLELLESRVGELYEPLGIVADSVPTEYALAPGVLSRASSRRVSLPATIPKDGAWFVRIQGRKGRLVYGVYSFAHDEATQFIIEYIGDDNERKEAGWIMEAFTHEPVRPGHWDFSWNPGNATDKKIDVKLDWDATRELFISR